MLGVLVIKYMMLYKILSYINTTHNNQPILNKSIFKCNGNLNSILCKQAETAISRKSLSGINWSIPTVVNRTGEKKCQHENE